MNNTTWAFRLPSMPLSSVHVTLGGSHMLYRLALRSVRKCGDQMLDVFRLMARKTR
jgi:hypothetical protein